MLVFLLLLVGVIVYFNGQFSNEKYVHQQSYSQYGSQGNQYRIVVVTDMDTDSRVKGEESPLQFRSILKQGELLRSRDGRYSVSWKDEVCFS
jgi:hypothetical protein